MKKFLAISILGLGTLSCSTWLPVENTVPTNPDCICTLEYAPVCVKGDGVIYRFPNACAAFCEGYTQDDFINHCPPE